MGLVLDLSNQSGARIRATFGDVLPTPQLLHRRLNVAILFLDLTINYY